jgi:hypothetical protein
VEQRRHADDFDMTAEEHFKAFFANIAEQLCVCKAELDESRRRVAELEPLEQRVLDLEATLATPDPNVDYNQVGR